MASDYFVGMVEALKSHLPDYTLEVDSEKGKVFISRGERGVVLREDSPFILALSARSGNGTTNLLGYPISEAGTVAVMISANFHVFAD